MTDDQETAFAELILESPSEVTTPLSSLGQAIFSEESLVMIAAKLSVVEAILKLIARDIKFSDLMREILMAVMQVIKCEAGTIFEVNYADNNLFFRAATGRSSDLVSKYTIPLGRGVVGHVAESKQPLLVNDAKEDKRHNRTISHAVAFEAHNLVAVPIVIRGKTYGVLELLNRVGEPHFSPTDLDLLIYVAEAISKAVEIRMMINWQKSTDKSSRSAA